MGCTVVGEL